MHENYYTSKEVKIKLGITGQTLKRWKDKGIISSKVVGIKKTWYLKADVDSIMVGC